MSFDTSLWEEVTSTSISDVMNGKNVMEYSINSIQHDAFITGPAITVQLEHDDVHFIFDAIDKAEPGSVLVIAGAALTYACMGDIMANFAHKKGIAGVIIDGCIRDSQNIKKMKMPVFCKGTIPCAPINVNKGGKMQIPIICGGAIVSPGDIIVADADGVVVIPQEQTQSIRDKAIKKEQCDNERKQKILLSI